MIHCTMAMIEAGLAEVYRGPESGNPYRPQYQAAEAAARAPKRGMWVLGNTYESPRAYRKRVGISERSCRAPRRPSMSPPDHHPIEPRASIRMDAHLDAATRAKVDGLAERFLKPRAGVVCHIMRWGLSRRRAGIVDGGRAEGPVRHLYRYVDTRMAWTSGAGGERCRHAHRALAARDGEPDHPHRCSHELADEGSRALHASGATADEAPSGAHTMIRRRGHAVLPMTDRRPTGTQFRFPTKDRIP
jgi:hypothetical protein